MQVNAAGRSGLLVTGRNQALQNGGCVPTRPLYAAPARPFSVDRFTQRHLAGLSSLLAYATPFIFYWSLESSSRAVLLGSATHSTGNSPDNYKKS